MDDFLPGVAPHEALLTPKSVLGHEKCIQSDLRAPELVLEVFFFDFEK